jgi:hypothetical protein
VVSNDSNGMFNLENPTWVCKSGFDFQTRRISRVRKSSSSSEDESYLDVLLITSLITNADSGRRIVKIVNFESTVVAAWDNQQFGKVFRMNGSSMQFFPFEF